MILERIACITSCIVFTSSVATGQQTSGPGDQEPARSVIEHTSDSGVTPWRVVRTRSASAGREVVIETVEEPNLYGRMSPIQETVTETVRSVPTSARVRSDVFGLGGDGRRRLMGTTESQQETLPNRDTSAVHSTFTLDVNGRTALTSKTIENVRTITPAMRQTDTAILLPDLNGALRETTRIERTERIDPSVVRDESTQLVRDVNGRWLATERRSDVIRQTGPSERLEEQTIEHLDVNGKVMIVEVHRMTTKTDGRSTLEEVEGPSLVSPGDPARVIRRTVTTVRPNGADRSITEREVFELDVNGRMTRVARETVESSGR